MNKSLILRIFSSVGVIALAGAMALAQDAAPSNAPRSDGQIEMDVVHALDGSQALKNDLITAATIQSEVTLSGTVSSDSSKQLAESIAKTVPGVTKVHNNLKVGNPADDANAQGAPTNDPSNGMADAQAGPPQDNGQNPNYNQNPGTEQGRAEHQPGSAAELGRSEPAAAWLWAAASSVRAESAAAAGIWAARTSASGIRAAARDMDNRDRRLRDTGSRRRLRDMDSARIMRRLRLRCVMRCHGDRSRFRRER